jgi:putative transposase
MPNTYSQIYLQFVFAVTVREALISKNNREELQRYMTALVQNRSAKLLAIYCMPDHTHLLVGIKSTVRISDFIKEIKVESNEFIIQKSGLKENSVGRKDMVYFLIHIPK